MIAIGGGAIADGFDNAVVSHFGAGSLALPLAVSIVPPAFFSGASTISDGAGVAAIWGIVVRVGGVDVSDQVIDEVMIEAEESASRVADVTLSLPSGSSLVPSEWTGRSVRIWLVDMSSGQPTAAFILFMGVVDTPTLDTTNASISLRCTDNRQEIISGMSSDQLAIAIPGSRWSSAVFDAGASSWVQANDRLETVSGSLDISPTGAIRYTPWQALDVADLTFTNDSVLDGSISTSFADRSSLTNQVDISFSYRFPIVKSEGNRVIYDFLALNNQIFVEWHADGGQFLNRASVLAAIEQSGGALAFMEWFPLPTTEQPLPGGGIWAPFLPLDMFYCLGFNAVVVFDYTQQVEEAHSISVTNGASVGNYGVLREAMRGALEARFESPAVIEQGITLFRKSLISQPPTALPAIVVGMTSAVVAQVSDDTNRAAANYAMETLIAIAIRKIADSHRNNTVTAAVTANPAIDVDKTIAIDTPKLRAKGKVRRVVHRLNPAEGRAVTEFELAISSAAGVGAVHSSDAIVAPDGSVYTPTAPEPPVVTWNGLLGGDNVFSIDFPAIAQTEREVSRPTFSTNYAAAIVEDLLEITL